ncbi:hypothetical protein LZ32DRAFT_677558 [Colletotrichum eremochloae]|nr:hypothetical protein LZ32DRAFT_677558 [Colletotrichum eremochloae]
MVAVLHNMSTLSTSSAYRSTMSKALFGHPSRGRVNNHVFTYALAGSSRYRSRLLSTDTAGIGAVFNYDAFYQAELAKKHADKSYRYFNNTNRLAKEFPRAHLDDSERKVTVWCSNDDLRMSRKPKVLQDAGYLRRQLRGYQKYLRS